jgi:hypothetical protein
MKPGPPGYSEEQRAKIIDHVVAELACGRSVKRILEEDEEMPASSQFWKWHFESEEIQEKVARARVHGADALMDETVTIADDATHDWRLKPKKDDEDEDDWAFDKENVLRSKLRVDTRQKYAQMIAPRKYGPKLDLTSGGEKLGLSAELEAARRRTGENG